MAADVQESAELDRALVLEVHMEIAADDDAVAVRREREPLIAAASRPLERPATVAGCRRPGPTRR